MQVKFDSGVPIFLQLAEIIKGDIVSGRLRAGERLPSVREFALIFSVNPNTVQKALLILEDEGLIITDRTNGKFASFSEKVIESAKRSVIKKEVKDFFERMKTLGFEKGEIIEIVKNEGV